MQQNPRMMFGHKLWLLALVMVVLLSEAPAAEGAGGLSLDKAYAPVTPFQGARPVGVDPSTLTGKVMCGYQGWFGAPGDGVNDRWVHYNAGKRFEPGFCTIDLWPDMTEYGKDERFPTEFRHADGRVAEVFSSVNSRSVLRHFEWMQQYGIDGIFLQRFVSGKKSAQSYLHNNTVLKNAREAAAATGRTWALMYDLSGFKAAEGPSSVIDDWKRLEDHGKIRADASYLRHGGKPVVAVWGAGFSSREIRPEVFGEIVDFLKSDPLYGGNCVMLGVPAGWATGTGAAARDEGWKAIYQKADILSPWAVGSYRNQGYEREIAKRANTDLPLTREGKQDYLPVIFPGFSWHNLKKHAGEEASLDAIPREGGKFLWGQARAWKNAGVDMLYVAMFDEIDEGTAIFKCTDDVPVGDSPLLTYQGRPSDHYLWLVGEIGRMVRGEVPPTPALPAR
jgi:hypothetical protein